jgi:hypothetical protein
MVFNSVSADGYFTGTKSDISWAHQNDPEQRSESGLFPNVEQGVLE